MIYSNNQSRIDRISRKKRIYDYYGLCGVCPFKGGENFGIGNRAVISKCWKHNSKGKQYSRHKFPKRKFAKNYNMGILYDWYSNPNNRKSPFYED